jgi:hypothetical protein
MINKIKKIVIENRELHRSKIELLKKNESHLQELEWAHIYHDSIRGIEWIENLNLNIGRWAGNYSFFYVLNRLLHDYKPKKILELGLGESTKFISVYLENYLYKSNHTIIEQDDNWSENFKKNFKLSKRSNIVNCPLEIRQVNGFSVNSYYNFESKVSEKFDLYIIDGPLGSERFSRFEIIGLIEKFSKDEEFIIVFDDINRKGETDTFKVLIELLKSKGIKIYIGEYNGIKSVKVIATEKYKYVQSL